MPRKAPPVVWPVVSVMQFSQLLDVSTGAVSAWLDDGMPTLPQAKPGQLQRIELGPALRWLFDKRRRRLSVRDRLADEQADKFGLENARRRGELLLVPHVADVFAELGANLVARLDAVPGRVAGELAGINDPGTIRERLLDENRTVRAALALAVDKLAELAGTAADAGGDPAPTAQTHVKRVGRRKSRATAGERGAGALAQ